MSGCIQQCWKFVTNFGLQWSLKNITKLKSSIEHILSVHWNKRGAENVKATKKTPNVGANAFWLIFSTKTESNTYPKKNLNHQHLHFTFPSQRNPMPQEVFPPKSSSEATAVFVLHIHGRLGLQEPLHHGIVAFPGCEVQRCPASGAADPRRKPPGSTQRERRGEKLWEKIWAPQKSKFWKLWHLKILPGLKLTLWIWDVPGDIELVQKNCFLWCSIEAVSAMFAINMDLDKLKHTPILEMPKIGTPQNSENNPLFSTCFVSYWLNSHMNWRNIGSNYEDLHIMIISSCGCVHATSERTLRKLRIAL